MIGYDIASHTDVNVLYHTLHCVIILHSAHPLKMYPSLLGFLSVISAVSTVYLAGLSPFVHPFNTYVISYSIAVHVAFNSLSPTASHDIDVTTSFPIFNHPKLYPLLIGS